MEQKLVRIVLGGRLGQLFGKEWQLYVSSPAEAIRAIDVNLKGKLRQYLSTTGAKKYYKVAIGREENLLDKGEIGNPSGHQDIYVLPTVKGRKSGWGKILVGVALIAAAIFMPAAWAAVGAWFGVAGGSVALSVGMLGASLVMGGVTQLLTPSPSFNSNAGTAADSTSSNIFAGNAASVVQGIPIPLVYGRALVAPMPVSISFAAVDQAKPNSLGQGGYVSIIRPGDIMDYQDEDPTPEDNIPPEEQQ